MKTIKWCVALFILSFVVFALWFVACFRPWMQPGRTVNIGEWAFGQYHLQVWQRKTDYLLEPFRTALFIRHETNEFWEAFSLGHEDRFHPAIILEKIGEKVIIYYGPKSLGSLDLESRVYLRTGQIPGMSEGRTSRPQDWWMSPGDVRK